MAGLEIIGAPAIQRMMGLPSTPENTGQTIDRTGTTDATTALNAWLASLVANGDEGYLGPGTFKTSAELLITDSGVAGKGIALRGAGPQNTIIKPTANTFNGLRVNLSGNQQLPKGYISDIGINCAASLPGSPNNKAAFMMDATTYIVTRGLSATGFDVGLDAINNCFNMAHYDFTVPRFGACNVGIYLRDGFTSGSDINIYNANISAALSAVVVYGNGGGFKFWGGQWGRQSAANAALGTITVGYDYVNGASVGSAGVDFYGIGDEGIKGYSIVNWGDNHVGVNQCNFNASTAGATGILNCANGAARSVIGFDGCGISGANWAGPLVVANQNFGLTNIFDGAKPWYVPAAGFNCTNIASGATQNAFAGLGALVGNGTGYTNDGNPAFLLGGRWMRFNGNVLQWSADRSTWTAV